MLERNGVVMGAPTEAPAQQAPEQAPVQQAPTMAPAARAEALAANAQGKGTEHVRAEYVPLDEAEAARKAARRKGEAARTPVDYQPYVW
ncbi:hypothetical protein SEA_CAIN_101 [Mycobacterium phage Cain]|uniref:Uncharacterized protein n=1 Tax=Mycobacterium phage Bryler TaxID=2653755 RepID=A0A5Q2WR86_9CAUD|nr:hypothetical protein I5G79_gp05 [Mycobacterium phage Bryler]ASR85400.1 hypothetical protein SEA_PHRANK_102 [Mycobacterium phage Phrank]ASR85500.1 hypothetical protein SEA_CAIN_101 [Mycobacterium phage Cain]UTN93291.1 hypothetical protein SEA_SUNFLOWER1121_99 [Mycobacterium Phage Sunflower1121]WNM67577.1 hypothetical protein SEA_SHADOW1_99 [Mycobacterium phage Shadow1]QGH80468.1 hypothetical protein SEA_BRYLER_93 [Mycobacterium phage Bryler]